MEIIQSTYDIAPELPDLINQYFQSHAITASDLIFFDIETTGLSPKVSSLTVVGACHIQDNKLICTQWFADDYISEPQILSEFTNYIRDYKAIVSFNGTGFDVPYLQKKCIAHHISSVLDEKEHIDLYKILRPYKSMLSLTNMKLQTLEAFLQLPRTDHYSGLQCIELYSEFMQGKYMQDPDASACKDHLLQHNLEDIIGTCLISKALSFVLPLKDNSVLTLAEQSQDYLTFQYEMPFAVNKAIHTTCGIQPGTTLASLDIQGTIWSITLRVACKTLYHFFPDYKNYYYLPAEDQAIHKDIAAYVDSEHRVKASASNCYIKKEGPFLPLVSWKKRDTSFGESPLFFNLSKSQAYIYWDGSLPTEYLLQIATAF